MEKKNNFEIMIIVFLLLFSFIMYGLYLVIEKYYEKYTYTLILDPLTILECKKWKCNDKTSNISEYNNKEYNVSADGKDIGKYTLYYDNNLNKFYIFDNKNNSIKYEDSLYGYNGSNIKSYMVNSTDIGQDEMYDILGKNKLSVNINDISYSKKIIDDFDNDGKYEEIYTIMSSIESSNYFNYLIYNDEGKYSIIFKQENTDSLKVGSGVISNVMDIFNDGKKEFVYRLIYYDKLGECNIVYRLKGNKFVSVNECNLNNN